MIRQRDVNFHDLLVNIRTNLLQGTLDGQRCQRIFCRVKNRDFAALHRIIAVSIGLKSRGNVAQIVCRADGQVCRKRN